MNTPHSFPISKYLQDHVISFRRILLKSLTTTRILFDPNTTLSRRTFFQEEKGKNGRRSIQICHQIKYVWMMKFKSTFQLIVIVQSFDTMSPQRQTLKKLFFFLGFLSQILTIHRTAGEGGGYIFNSSLPLPPTSQTLRH